MPYCNLQPQARTARLPAQAEQYKHMLQTCSLTWWCQSCRYVPNLSHDVDAGGTVRLPVIAGGLRSPQVLAPYCHNADRR